MILKDLEINQQLRNNYLGELSLYKTLDGSLSLNNTLYKEAFHSKYGAKKEALEKFVKPAEIDKFRGKELIALDVCFGMGYNTASLIEELQSNQIFLSWWGIEIDKRPLELALEYFTENRFWSEETINILKSINSYSLWETKSSKGEIIWGDARQKAKEIPKHIRFDLIMLDAFSPTKCPGMWSIEFLQELTSKLSSQGRLITYSSAASIRNSLQELGLKIMSIQPVVNGHGKWSSGTIATLKGSAELENSQHNLYKPLTAMEKEHLTTKAAIPYRDPTGCSSNNEIIDRRVKEQNASSFSSTSSWKRKWKDAKPNL